MYTKAVFTGLIVSGLIYLIVRSAIGDPLQAILPAAEGRLKTGIVGVTANVTTLPAHIVTYFGPTVLSSTIYAKGIYPRSGGSTSDKTFNPIFTILVVILAAVGVIMLMCLFVLVHEGFMDLIRFRRRARVKHNAERQRSREVLDGHPQAFDLETGLNQAHSDRSAASSPEWPMFGHHTPVHDAAHSVASDSGYSTTNDDGSAAATQVIDQDDHVESHASANGNVAHEHITNENPHVDAPTHEVDTITSQGATGGSLAQQSPADALSVAEPTASMAARVPQRPYSAPAVKKPSSVNMNTKEFFSQRRIPRRGSVPSFQQAPPPLSPNTQADFEENNISCVDFAYRHD
ncbi:hypothetical protein GGR50DRAFT_700309 [Xylaria sp. CBS 124048]|nr:hypothetical protein GGR50DRAFT_700309 [Xylaria sp. CBS 124048]